MINQLEAAYAAVPRHVELTDALERARDFAARIPAAVPAGAVQRQLYDTFTAGQTIDPADFLAQVAGAFTAEQTTATAQRIAQVTIDGIAAEVTSVRRNNTDAAIDYLRSQLADVMTVVAAEAKHLAGISTADDAIAAGTKPAQAWKNLAAGAATYDALRAAQVQITSFGYDAGPQATEAIERFGIIRDADAYPPLSIELAGTATIGVNDILNFGATAWPDATPAFLLWANANHVELWIPYIDELRSVADTHRAAVRDADHRRRTHTNLGPDRARVERLLLAAERNNAITGNIPAVIR